MSNAAFLKKQLPFKEESLLRARALVLRRSSIPAKAAIFLETCKFFGGLQPFSDTHTQTVLVCSFFPPGRFHFSRLFQGRGLPVAPSGNGWVSDMFDVI